MIEPPSAPMGKNGRAQVPLVGGIAEGYFLTNFFTLGPNISVM